MLSSKSVYCLENVPLYEAIYGKNLISLGGITAINSMFSDIDLKDKSALDIGFGLGGVAYYLAERFKIQVSGVEVHAWMAAYAKNHAPKNIAPLLTFEVYDNDGRIPFEPASFDLVYSKGVLNHVEEKDLLFQQIHEVLKPNGIFVITDWIYSEDYIDDGGPLVKETKKSYKNVLERVGFKNIQFRDDSEFFFGYVKNLLENLIVQRSFIENKYGTDMYSAILNDHQKLCEEIKKQNKFAVRIIAHLT